MDWLNIEFVAPAQQHTQLCELLEEAGALAVTSLDAADRPVLEPAPGETPLWPQVRVVALFAGDYDPQPLQALLRAGGLVAVSCEPLSDADWVRRGQDVTVRHFGGRLWVCPSGAPAPAPDACVLRLDAGLAFGTGSHPTTGGCLRWLAGHPPQGLEVIDYGCGSGILAVAAAMLGARRVQATDLDPQALRATADNAARNGVADRVTVCEAAALVAPVDLILANILAPVLIDLAPRLQALLRPGGVLLLSGVLESQLENVVSAYTPAMRFSPARIDHGWVCVQAVKQ